VRIALKRFFVFISIIISAGSLTLLGSRATASFTVDYSSHSGVA
jgi:hypothetical protein